MTFVGHILTGLSIGTLAMPRRWGRRGKAALLLAFAFLAEVPDVKLPYWGHHRYDISHSLMMNLLIAGIPALVLLFWAAPRRRLGGAAVIVMGLAAVLSHLLLDSFYNHNEGVMIGWPINEYRLNLSLPWFTAMVPAWNLTFARVLAVEALFYGPLLLACIAARRLAIRLTQPTGPLRPTF